MTGMQSNVESTIVEVDTLSIRPGDRSCRGG
jgi:hypothetical protein